MPDPVEMTLLFLGAFAAFFVLGLLALVMKQKTAGFILLGLSLLPLLGGLAFLLLIMYSGM